MKKILFFVAMVVLTAAVASAQIAVTASGDATTSFGIDLDEMDTGFEYSGSATISVSPEIDMDSAASAHEDDVYGEFSISGIALGTGDVSGASGSAPINLSFDSIAAKIVLGDLTINLYDAPGLGVSFNDDIANAYDYDIFDGKYGAGSKANDADAEFHPGGLGEDTITANAGIQLVYALPDVMDIRVDFMSHDTWSDQTFENEYALRLGLDLTAVENLTLGVAANMAFYDVDEFIAIGAKLAYAIAIGEEDSITPSVGFMYLTDDPDGQMGISGGVNVSIAGIVLTANAGFYDTDLGTDGAGLDYTVALDLGLVDGLTAQAAFEAQDADITVDGSQWGLHAKVGYEIAGDVTITPSAQVSYDDPSTEVDDDEEMYAKVDVEISGLLENTTFHVEWDSNDLLDNDGGANGVMGQVVLSTTVSL